MIRKEQKQKGFTLIELLVVIAIIGILSGTVIVSMSGTQGAAQNSRIKSSLGQLRTATEVYKFSKTSPSYDNVNMWANGPINDLLGDIKIQNGGTDVVKGATASTWCASSILRDSTDHWCVSNTGFIGESECTVLTGICE